MPQILGLGPSNIAVVTRHTYQLMWVVIEVFAWAAASVWEYVPKRGLLLVFVQALVGPDLLGELVD